LIPLSPKQKVPELSRFYGIVIRIFYDDHFPPHFHVKYGEHKALIELDSLALLRGDLPARAHGLVVEWAKIHKKQLKLQWERAQAGEQVEKIPPLD